MFNLFKKHKEKQLEQEVKDLQAKLIECKGKLEEKQEHINKTNAYWKKQMAMIKGLSKSYSKKS